MVVARGGDRRNEAGAVRSQNHVSPGGAIRAGVGSVVGILGSPVDVRAGELLVGAFFVVVVPSCFQDVFLVVFIKERLGQVRNGVIAVLR